jgi:flavin reductase (DIM6/NTAB) family NADH-FMN oxidoreductase RutF
MTGASIADDRAAFRRVCGEFATGVTAVTARTADGELAALTANSFTSVSLDPPLVLVCVGTSVSCAGVMRRAEHVAIHILGESHEHVARRFATSGTSAEERLDGIARVADEGGAPVLDECTARFAGPVERCVDAGDHMIIVVHAEHAEIVAEDHPALMFFRGKFWSPS